MEAHTIFAVPWFRQQPFLLENQGFFQIYLNGWDAAVCTGELGKSTDQVGVASRLRGRNKSGSLKCDGSEEVGVS